METTKYGVISFTLHEAIHLAGYNSIPQLLQVWDDVKEYKIIIEGKKRKLKIR